MNKKENIAFCPICLKKHSILQVEVEQEDIFHNQKICYTAQYDYCEINDEQWSNEEQLKKNSVRLKDAYRKSVGLLTSEEIKAIRKKYKITQEVLATILGWGKKTITRYETVSIQDQVHDDVLRKIDVDPLWFFDFIRRSKDELDQKQLEKYVLSLKKNQLNTSLEFSEKSLCLEYYDIDINEQVGNVRFDPDRLKIVINYLATKIPDLSKNRATQLLLLADFLHYCKYDHGITGLAYSYVKNYILPKGHENIFNLEGIHMKEIMENDYSRYIIMPDFKINFDILNKTEIKVLDVVINKPYKYDLEKIIEKINTTSNSAMEKPLDLLSYNIACDLELSVN